MAKRLSVEGVRPLIGTSPISGNQAAVVWISAGYARPAPPVRYFVEYDPNSFRVVKVEHHTKTGWRKCARSSYPKLQDILPPAIEAAVQRGAFSVLRSGERVSHGRPALTQASQETTSC